VYQLSYRVQHMDQLDSPGWRVQLPQLPSLRRRDPKSSAERSTKALPVSPPGVQPCS
jgi:hypothetical protein